MSGEQKIGLYSKYRVERTDGTSGPGEKHERCRYFVLDLDHDPFAKPAILAYAKECEKTHPVLAEDLREMASHYRFSGGRTGITNRCVGPGRDGTRCRKRCTDESGWFVRIRPVEGWLCPSCFRKFSDTFHFPEVRLLPRATQARSKKAFAHTKSKDGEFPI